MIAGFKADRAFTFHFSLSTFYFLLSTYLPHQPSLRRVPIARHGRDRDAERLRRLLQAQAAEIAQFDDAAFALVHLGQLPQRIVELDQFSRAVSCQRHRLVERDLLRPAAALLVI